jgi:hypothetical protein
MFQDAPPTREAQAALHTSSVPDDGYVASDAPKRAQARPATRK